MNAPIAMDNPANCMSAAAPSTTASAAAIITSRAPVRAMIEKSGSSRYSPASTSAATHSTATRIAPQSMPTSPPAASSGTRMSSGTMARSWNSRIEKARRP